MTNPYAVCDTCGDSGRCTYPSIETQTIVVVACPDCGSTSNEPTH